MSLLLILLAACGPDATPLPVIQTATPSPPPAATDVPDIRYAIAANAVNYVPDRALLDARTNVENLEETADPAQLGPRFDIIATYGEYTGWIRAEITPRVMLVINPNADPLTPDTADLLRRAVNPAAAAEATGIPGALPTSSSTPPSPKSRPMSTCASPSPSSRGTRRRSRCRSGALSAGRRSCEDSP